MKNYENDIMRQAATFLFTFLSKRENAPFSMSLILVVMMGWWNIKQADEQVAERNRLNMAIMERDSMARAERQKLYETIGAQNAEILLCKTAYERLETEIKSLRREFKKR